MPDKDPLNISGQVVAEKYRIEHLVGEGGFAMVYLAEHTIWKQPVAVKFFSGLSQAPAEHREELLQQFVQEGALLTELSSLSAGIVQARDVGVYTTPTGQWMPFMVLEWLDGVPLDTVMAEDQHREHPWTEDEVVGFLQRILPILDVAHRRGIAHRDIKPANIFIMGSATRAPDTPCKLLDFGVAKMVSDQAMVNAAFAKTGVAITSFTPRYGAPEQFTRSYGATGPWTDVYSVALVACEMLTGRVALQGEDLVQYGFSSANPLERPTPRFLGAQVSDHLEAVFAKALAVRPEDRFQNAGEFLESTLATAVPETIASFDPAPVSPPPAASPSPSLQLAPTVLVPTERPAAVAIEAPAASPPTGRPERPATGRPERPATTKPEPEEPEEAKSSWGALFVLGLVVLAGALVVFSTTELTGAREVRGLISAAVHLVRKEAVQHIPELREKTRQAVNNAAGILGGTGGKAGTTAECPPGTRRVTSFPVHGRDETAGSGEHGPTGPVCVDEHLVSEDDYAGCVSCERPGPSSPRAKGKTRGHSEFCLKDRSPTSNPIRCVTWKQADAYCQAHTGRLPTEDELRAVTPAATKATEWTQATPRAGRERWGSFRCVRSL